MMIATLGVFTVARASDSDTRSGNQRINSIADAAADAAVAAAIARIQRVGSVKGDADETDGSTLDVEGAEINGADDTDGTYNIKVQSGQPGCYNPRQRLLTVTAKAEGQTRRRYLCFWVVPRIMRFGLYTDGSAASDKAAEIKSGFSVLLPPPYKAPTGARGSDMGSNGDVDFLPGAYANNRNTVAGSLTAVSNLYDHLFVPSGTAEITNQVRYRFGTEGNPGIRWGSLYRAPKLGSSSGVLPEISGVTTGVNFDTPAALNSNEVGSFAPVTLATRTQPPDFSNKLAQWRQKATSQGNIYIPGDTQATPDDFQSDMNQLGTQTMQGVVYVACTNNQTVTIPSGKKLIVESGALIMEGCNLSIAEGASLIVKRDLSDPFYKLKGSNAGSCPSEGELSPAPGGCAWAYPGLAVLADADGRGGKVDSDAQGSNYVDINGNVIVDRDLTIKGGTLPPGGKLGNWNTSGTTFVDGKLSAEGIGGAAVFRWIPLGQRMDFDYSTARIGTYSLRTEERSLPTAAPTVTFTDKPENPSDQTDAAEFAWEINGSYDTVACTITKQGGSANTVACDDTAASLTGLEYPANYTFSVRVCVLGLDATRTQRQFCGTASYDWYIKGPPASVQIDNSSKPSDPSFSRTANFTWSVNHNPNSITCRMDGGSWGSCVSPPGYSATDLAQDQNHTFEVKACNTDGCGTDSHTWYVAGPPKVNITNKPSSPQPYTATSLTLNWTVSGLSISSTQCSNTTGDPAPAESWASCSSPTSKTLSGLGTGENHNFKVQICNPAGCGSDSVSWYINPAPPSCSFTSTPANPSQYNITSPTFTWSCTGGPITSRECRAVPSPDNGGGWGSCSNPPSSDQRTWASCKTHTFQMRASNISGTSTPSHTWSINCEPPTLRFTAYPANPSATFDASGTNTATSGPFTWEVTNGVPVSGYECKTDSNAWAACSTATSPASYNTGALDGNAVYGVSHTFKVRGISSGGTGAEITYSWVIHPNKPSLPTWDGWGPNGGMPTRVGENVGSQAGDIYYWGAAATIQCYDANGTVPAWGVYNWYNCSNGNSFALGGYCSDTEVGIRATNISGTAEKTTRSVHRNCNYPSQTLRWTSGNNQSKNAEWGTRSREQTPGSNAYISWCRVVRDTWTGTDIPWGPVGGGCPNPLTVSYVGQTSWFYMESRATANDGSATTGNQRTQAYYNSDAYGRNCVYVSGSFSC